MTAWCHRVLYNLFFGVKVDDEKDFKGAALERLVHRGSSVLPTGECRALDGASKQIDAAFAVDEVLVICECKAIWRSFGVERGDRESLNFRSREVVDRAPTEADDKATWLRDHPVGTNYDVRKYRELLPVGVSPFVEYIGTLDSRYWLKPDLPRVLTPGELEELLISAQEANFRRDLRNVIRLA